jgi:hypothetical protein
MDPLTVFVPRVHALQIDPLGLAYRDWWDGGGGGAGAGTLVLTDHFDEVSTTYLENHTPDFGGPWTWNNDGDWSTASAWNLQIAAGSGQVALRSSSTNAGEYLPESGSADLDITAVFQTDHTGTGEALIYFRSLLAERTGYSFGLRSGDRLSLDKWTTTTPTNLYESGDLSTGVSITARMRIVGTAIKLWLTDILDIDTPVYDNVDGTHAGPNYIHAFCSGFGGCVIKDLEVREL